MKPFFSASFALFLLPAGCGGGSGAAEPEAAPVERTTGGEEEPRMVQVLRTTTPVPVPQPAIPREELVEPLQQLWTRTEEIVAIRPPEPPTEATAEAIRAWAEDPFAPWVAERQRAVQEAEAFVEAIGEEPVPKAVSAALFGYLYEDTAAGIRGAPVPVEIAEDEELLGLYVAALNDALQPFAQRSVESYAFCATTLVQQNEEPWADWAHYCLEHGREVASVYDLSPDDFPTAEPPASEGGEGGAEAESEHAGASDG